MTTRQFFRWFVLLACLIGATAGFSQTTRVKPRVFLSDQFIRAGQHLHQKPTETIDDKRAQAIRDNCSAVVVTATPDNADYFLLWWRGLRDAFALYDADGHLIVRGSTDAPHREKDVAHAVCKFVGSTEKPHSQRTALSLQPAPSER